MPQSYRFGQIDVRPAERRVIIEGQPVNLGARAFDLLVTLIAHRDRVMSKDELLQLVWPGLIVEENNLQVQVSTLRKLLGNHAIATIPGHGYRFTLKCDNDKDSDSDDSNPSPLVIAAARHNLPLPLNSFIGREREISQLKELLATTRLVTLTSMGGTGKTRLSLQVATDIQNEYANGVWLVELAALTDARLVPEAVAAVLGVKEIAGRPVIEALEKFVKDRQLLLILDNCEHVVEAAAALAKNLLRAGRGVQILASSRERLQLMGETAYPVPALAVPDLFAEKSADERLTDVQLAAFKQNEAVRLFVDRASAVQRNFTLTEKNAAAVATICRQLDGIPLAIELAAARVYTMSVEQIAVRLGDRFNLLNSGDKTTMPRQQTLRASIEWSVDLLLPAERALLQQLSVFAGGATLAAIEAVGEIGGSETTVLNILIQLVEKSLLVVDADGERYRMLETVRQYAHEKLVACGQNYIAHKRHLDFYCDLAELARPQLVGPEQGAWLAKLDIERENFLAAHRHAACTEEGAAQGLRLVWALKPYWITRGYLRLGLQLALEALAHPNAAKRDVARCRGLFDAGWFCVVTGENHQARSHLEESLAIARELGDVRRIAVALQPLGLACLGLGDTAAARAHLQEALNMAREQGEKREIAAALNVLAQLYRVVGEYGDARTHYEQSLQLSRELNERENVAIILLNLSMVLIEQQSENATTPTLIEALIIADEIKSKRLTQCVLEVSAGYAAACSEWSLAARLYGVTEALAKETGLQRDPADEAFLAPRIKQTRQILNDTVFANMEAEGRSLQCDIALRETHDWLASKG